MQVPGLVARQLQTGLGVTGLFGVVVCSERILRAVSSLRIGSLLVQVASLWLFFGIAQRCLPVVGTSCLCRCASVCCQGLLPATDGSRCCSVGCFCCIVQIWDSDVSHTRSTLHDLSARPSHACTAAQLMLQPTPPNKHAPTLQAHRSLPRLLPTHSNTSHINSNRAAARLHAWQH